MTILKNVVLLCSFVFLLAGCNEYTTQLCTQANKVDVPGFEGNHTVVSYDSEKHTVQKGTFAVTHNGLGSYIMNNVAVSTCAFGKTVIAESPNADHNTFVSYILTSGASYIDFVLASLDKAEMDAASVPNQMVKFPNGDEALVTDNSKVPAQTVVNLLHGTSIVIRIY
jgi:hypothetical protein